MTNLHALERFFQELYASAFHSGFHPTIFSHIWVMLLSRNSMLAINSIFPKFCLLSHLHRRVMVPPYPSALSNPFILEASRSHGQESDDGSNIDNG